MGNIISFEKYEKPLHPPEIWKCGICKKTFTQEHLLLVSYAHKDAVQCIHCITQRTLKEMDKLFHDPIKASVRYFGIYNNIFDLIGIKDLEKIISKNFADIWIKTNDLSIGIARFYHIYVFKPNLLLSLLRLNPHIDLNDYEVIKLKENMDFFLEAWKEFSDVLKRLKSIRDSSILTLNSAFKIWL